MKINVPAQCKTFTHQGAPSTPLKPIAALRRSVMAHMLWEDSFYEDGVAVADRVAKLCEQVDSLALTQLTIEVHKKGLLRHMPLYLAVQLLKKKDNAAAHVIEAICTRPDQMTELLALYWKSGRCKLAAQLKKGLAAAFVKFDAHRLAKWNRDSVVKLRDVMFLCHPKPKDEAQAATWKQLIDGTLPTADTWESRLSAGEDKKESFQALLEQGKLGLLAMLMNMRNMSEAGVPKALVQAQLAAKASQPMLPFKFLAAAKAAPAWEDIIDAAMIASVSQKPKLLGKTVVMVDVSGSMDSAVSGKSQMLRMEAACAFAILLRECCEDVTITSFSEHLCGIVPRRGMALAEAIMRSQAHSGTHLHAALNCLKANVPEAFDRIIVVTDEQVSAALPHFPCPRKYVLNVAAYANGIGTQDGWLTISGFSEASIDYIREVENDK